MRPKKIDIKYVLGFLGGFIFLLLFTLLSYWLGFGVIGEGKLSELVERAGVYGPLLIILMKSLTLVLAPLSGGPIYILTALLYGFFGAFLITFIGDLFGSTICFLIARKLGRKVALRLTGKRSLRIIDKLYHYLGEWRGFLVVSFLPVQDLASYAAGFTRMSYREFITVILITRIIINTFYVSLAFFPKQSILIKVAYLFLILVYSFFVSFFSCMFS